MALNFDFSSIPSNEVINKAELFLFNKMFVIESANYPPCSLFTIEKEWKETEFTWFDAKSDLQWENIDNASGSLGGGDHSIDPVAITDCKGVNKWMSFDITELVRSIVSGTSIHGLLFKEVLNGTDNDFSEGCTIASSEADELENRPKVVIDYGVTAISDLKNNSISSLNIYETKNSFIINGINDGVLLLIYSISGKLIKSVNSINRKLTLNKCEVSKGTLIMRVGNESLKIVNN